MADKNFKLKKRSARDLLTKGKKKDGGSGGGAKTSTFIKYIPKDGELRVQFLTDIDDWAPYYEVWDDSYDNGIDDNGKRRKSGRFVPFSLDEDYDDLEERFGAKPGRRFLAPAIDLDDNRPILVKINPTTATGLLALDERKGPLSKWNVSLFKDGEGTDTKYHVLPEGESGLDLSKIEVPDAWKVLEELLNPSDDIEDEAIADDADVATAPAEEEETEEAPAAAKPKFKIKK